MCSITKHDTSLWVRVQQACAFCMVPQRPLWMYHPLHVSAADIASPIIKLHTSCCDHILLDHSTQDRHISPSAGHQPSSCSHVLACCCAASAS